MEGINADSVELGLVKLKNEADNEQAKIIRSLPVAEGFDWLDDQKTKFIEEIKRFIMVLEHYDKLY